MCHCRFAFSFVLFLASLLFFAIQFFMVASAIVEEQFFANFDISVGEHADPVGEIAKHDFGIDVSKTRLCSMVDEANFITHALRVDRLIFYSMLAEHRSRDCRVLTSVQIEYITQLLKVINGTSSFGLVSSDDFSLVFTNEFILSNWLSRVQTKAMNRTTAEKCSLRHAALNGDVPASSRKVLIIVPVNWIQDDMCLT